MRRGPKKSFIFFLLVCASYVLVIMYYFCRCHHHPWEHQNPNASNLHHGQMSSGFAGVLQASDPHWDCCGIKPVDWTEIISPPLQGEESLLDRQSNSFKKIEYMPLTMYYSVSPVPLENTKYPTQEIKSYDSTLRCESSSQPKYIFFIWKIMFAYCDRSTSLSKANINIEFSCVVDYHCIGWGNILSETKI